MKHTLFGVDASLLLGACSCAVAALASKQAAGRPASARLRWNAVAAAQGAFAVELLLGWRYWWHDAAQSLLRSHDGYAGREPWQAALIATVAVLWVAAGTIAWRLARGDRLAALATCASAAMAALLLVEAVSLHAVDAVMYRPLGPVVAVAWAWVATAVVVTAAAVATRRRRAP